jgi:hypothetical protein
MLHNSYFINNDISLEILKLLSFDLLSMVKTCKYFYNIYNNNKTILLHDCNYSLSNIQLKIKYDVSQYIDCKPTNPLIIHTHNHKGIKAALLSYLKTAKNTVVVLTDTNDLHKWKTEIVKMYSNNDNFPNSIYIDNENNKMAMYIRIHGYNPAAIKHKIIITDAAVNIISINKHSTVIIYNKTPILHKRNMINNCNIKGVVIVNYYFTPVNNYNFINYKTHNNVKKKYKNYTKNKYNNKINKIIDNTKGPYLIVNNENYNYKLQTYIKPNNIENIIKYNIYNTIIIIEPETYPIELFMKIMTIINHMDVENIYIFNKYKESIFLEKCIINNKDLCQYIKLFNVTINKNIKHTLTYISLVNNLIELYGYDLVYNLPNYYFALLMYVTTKDTKIIMDLIIQHIK